MSQVLTKAPVEESGAYKFQDVGSPLHHAYNLPAIQSLLPDGKQTILDAGCGAGQVSGWLAKLGHDVWGCDPSNSGVELAKHHFPKADFFVSDLMEGPPTVIPMGGYDGIVNVEVIEHLFDPEKLLSNLHSALRPDGWIILTTPYHGYLKNLTLSLTNGWDKHFMVNSPGGHIKFFSPATLRNMLEDVGFSDIKIIGAGRAPLLWKSMVIFARKK